MEYFEIKKEMLSVLPAKYEARVNEILDAIPLKDIVLVKSTRNEVTFLSYFDKQKFYKGREVLDENIETLHGNYTNRNAIDLSKLGISSTVSPINITTDVVILLKTFLIKENNGTEVKKIIYIYKKEDKII